MKKKEKDLRSQINDLLPQAEAADAEEDAATSVPDPYGYTAAVKDFYIRL